MKCTPTINGPRCREFQPTNPYDIVKKPSAKTPQAPKHRPEPALIPFSPLVRPFGERKSGAVAEVDHKGARYSEQDLLRAVASGNKAKLELMLQAGISANAKDEQGQSALTMATALPSKDVAELLITHGANVNSRNNEGATPLMVVIITGHKETAKLLLRKGAEVNALDPVGSVGSHPLQQMTMLFIAIAIGDVEITKLLIEEGADVNLKLSDGQQALSPLAFALRSNQQDIAQLLIATGTKKSPKGSALTETHGALEAHIQQLEGRRASLCKEAQEVQSRGKRRRHLYTCARNQCGQGIWVLP